jgi:hypothetical protein
MSEPQHRTALVGVIEPESDAVEFSMLRVAGVFRGEYLIQEGNYLRTVEEIDNPKSSRAVRLMWEGESVTETHRETLTSRLLYRN